MWPVHLHPCIRAVSGFGFRCNFARTGVPTTHFLFVSPGLCLRLPSDSTSRWTPLSSANSSHCQACRDFHPQGSSHARRTTSYPAFGLGPFDRFCVYSSVRAVLAQASALREQVPTAVRAPRERSRRLRPASWNPWTENGAARPWLGRIGGGVP